MRHQSPLSDHRGPASLQNPVANAPSRADATAPDTSCKHYNDPSPRCRKTSHPTAREPRGPRVTCGPQIPSPSSSPPPITTPVCYPDASWSHRDGPPLARGRSGGLPLRARRTPPSWLAPMGRSAPPDPGRPTPPPSPALRDASVTRKLLLLPHTVVVPWRVS